MRSTVGVLAAVVALLGGAALAMAKTPQEELEAALKKHAPDVSLGERNRAACICLDGSGINFRTGWLRRTIAFAPTRFEVRCFVIGFGSSGDVNSLNSTCTLYAVLPK